MGPTWAFAPLPTAGWFLGKRTAGSEGDAGTGPSAEPCPEGFGLGAWGGREVVALGLVEAVAVFAAVGRTVAEVLLLTAVVVRVVEGVAVDAEGLADEVVETAVLPVRSPWPPPQAARAAASGSVRAAAVAREVRADMATTVPRIGVGSQRGPSRGQPPRLSWAARARPCRWSRG